MLVQGTSGIVALSPNSSGVPQLHSDTGLDVGIPVGIATVRQLLKYFFFQCRNSSLSRCEVSLAKMAL